MKETKLPTEDRLLPDTRLELLKDTLRYRFLDVVLLSILTGLFFLPLILWIVVATSLGLLDSSSIASVLLTYGIAILGFMIAGFGLGGTFYVCNKIFRLLFFICEPIYYLLSLFVNAALYINSQINNSFPRI